MGTVIVLLILALIVGASVYSMIRDKKSGKGNTEAMAKAAAEGANAELIGDEEFVVNVAPSDDDIAKLKELAAQIM